MASPRQPAEMRFVGGLHDPRRTPGRVQSADRAQHPLSNRWSPPDFIGNPDADVVSLRDERYQQLPRNLLRDAVRNVLWIGWDQFENLAGHRLFPGGNSIRATVRHGLVVLVCREEARNIANS
jgi:hypothetical protein